MSSLDRRALLLHLRNAGPLKIAAAVGTFSLLGWITIVLRSNYLRWKAIGPGGVPRNPYGWALQWLLDLVLGHRDTTYLLYFDLKLARMKGMTEQDRALATRRFLEDLPPRKAPKARAAPFAIPQRQKIAGTGLEMLEAQRKLFNSIAESNKSLVTVGKSRLEPYDVAMLLPEDFKPPEVAGKNRNEVSHIHGTEGSYHVTLSCADAKEVISNGWGERHRLAGTYLNLGYVFVYAPRDLEEVEVMGKMLKAGIAFMSGGKEVS